VKRLDRIDVSDQWRNRDLSAGVNKKRDGITILAATVNDPMRRGGKEAITPLSMMLPIWRNDRVSCRYRRYMD